MEPLTITPLPGHEHYHATLQVGPTNPPGRVYVVLAQTGKEELFLHLTTAEATLLRNWLTEFLAATESQNAR